MSDIKSSSRYSSKKSLPYEKALSSTISQINKNRDDIIKNKVYCPIELKNVYTLLEDSDKILRKKDSDINNLFKYNDKICEFINICEHYKIHMNSQQKPELKKTYNSIEHNIQYLSKHIETAKKDNILLKKKLKRSTDPLFLLTLEQKNKQLCIDIENRKKEIKFLKESIRKNEKLLDSNKKKPNPVSLEKEYRNLLNQQSNLCSRLIQLQNGSRLYEESIQRIDDQLEEIKKKMNDLNLEKKNEKEHLIEGVSDMSKENLEKKIFLLNTKRDELKKEKNNIINNLNNSLLKLKKQISVLENEKINLLNDEKSHIEKSQILKRTLNTKMNKMNKHENKIKTNVIKKKDMNKKEQIEEQQEDNTLKEDNKNEKVHYVKDIKEDNDIQHYNENNKYMYQQNIHSLKYEQNVERYDRTITPQPSNNFIESLLEDQTPEHKQDINPIIKTQEDVSKPWEENGNNNIYDDINNENITKYNTKKKKIKNNSNVFLPQFEEDILLKLQKTVNMKLNEKKEKEQHMIQEEIKDVEQDINDDDVVEEEIKDVKQDINDDDVVEEEIKKVEQDINDDDMINEEIKKVEQDINDDDVVEEEIKDVEQDINDDDVVEEEIKDVEQDINDDDMINEEIKKVEQDINDDDVVDEEIKDVKQDINDDDVVEEEIKDVKQDINDDDVVEEEIKKIEQDINDDDVTVEEEIDERDEHENKINEPEIHKEIIKEDGILDDIINNDEIKMNDNIKDEFLEKDKKEDMILRDERENETYTNNIQQYNNSYNITNDEQTFKDEDIFEKMNNNDNFKEINEPDKDMIKQENIILHVTEKSVMANDQIEKGIQNKEEEINEDMEKETLNF
ncbi:conserved Plasmodium protein, unknown function [Plasmodium reichenowi]|uniref:Uncharacterized protein n=2 Tax=Plasmodium reichenowi TaxID=5854 RepID=A0A060RTC0_PLARE|nr:conserved Plasmodium protein, unknown function [Plasmodium reichenowi]